MTTSITLDTARFLFEDIEIAIPDVSPGNIRSWFARGVATLSEHDRHGRASGKRILMTLRTIYEFAIAGAMVGLGMPPAMGFACARHITRGNAQGRDPDTLLCERGHTLLLVWRGAGPIKQFDAAEPYSNMVEIYNLDPNNNEGLFEFIFKNGAYGATILFVNPILENVDRNLKILRPEKLTPRPAKSARAAKVG
jgi:hypothetical protein